MSSVETQLTTKPKRTVRHRVFTAVGIVLCALLIPIVIVNCTLIVKQFLNEDEVPSVGGVFPMIVLTDSMAPTFNAGSLIICNTIDAKDVVVGDIICFFDPAGKGTTTVTHRVQEVQTDGAGNISFITKGDANNTIDKTPVPQDKLVGIYKFHIEGLGSFAMFMQTTQGLIIFAVLPIILLVAYDVIRRRLYDKQQASDADGLMAELESLRAQQTAIENGEIPPSIKRAPQLAQDIPSIAQPASSIHSTQPIPPVTQDGAQAWPQQQSPQPVWPEQQLVQQSEQQWQPQHAQPVAPQNVMPGAPTNVISSEARNLEESQPAQANIGLQQPVSAQQPYLQEQMQQPAWSEQQSEQPDIPQQPVQWETTQQPVQQPVQQWQPQHAQPYVQQQPEQWQVQQQPASWPRHSESAQQTKDLNQQQQSMGMQQPEQWQAQQSQPYMQQPRMTQSVMPGTPANVIPSEARNLEGSQPAQVNMGLQQPAPAQQPYLQEQMQQPAWPEQQPQYAQQLQPQPQQEQKPKKSKKKKKKNK